MRIFLILFVMCKALSSRSSAKSIIEETCLFDDLVTTWKENSLCSKEKHNGMNLFFTSRAPVAQMSAPVSLWLKMDFTYGSLFITGIPTIWIQSSRSGKNSNSCGIRTAMFFSYTMSCSKYPLGVYYRASALEIACATLVSSYQNLKWALTDSNIRSTRN